MEKKYLIWMDILGFKGLAEEIAKKKGIEERRIREHFVNIIEERIRSIEAKGEIAGKNYSERDDWILIIKSLDSAFKVVTEILEHNTGYKDYEQIPLEIVIGVGEYDKWVKLDGREIIFEQSTINFLKTKIIDYYHEWYRQKYYRSPTSTFMILTEPAYNELEPLEKTLCQRIKYAYQKANGKQESVIFYIADLNKVQRRGLMFEFLEKIGHSGSKLYDRIDDLYVPPIEYEEIKEKLEKDRIVFITGTAEYGKTYTAVRLLWEYFLKGYEPLWIRGGDLWERKEVRKRLEEIEKELTPRRIIYFEDPFGKTRYERRESLEREISRIIDCISNVKDVYVILTAREEIFKEFEEEHLSYVELKKFEKKLNIKKPSYDYERRREILLKWAEAKVCKWLSNDNLTKLVLTYIKDKTKLPTPLSIKNFVISTIFVDEENEIVKRIKEKSEETAMEFGREIQKMTGDKALFLSFPFISVFDVEFVKRKYKELVEELHIKNAWEFGKILDWFKDDKISIVSYFSRGGRYVMFSHPSYAEALRYILVKKGQITRLNRNIFSKVLLNLSGETVAAESIAKLVVNNFDKFPEDVRNELLFRLSEQSGAVKYVGIALLTNFSKLEENVRNQLLVKLSEKEEAVFYIASAFVANFSKIPENLRELLFRLSEKEETAEAVARVIVETFDRLPINMASKLLLKLAENRRAAWVLAKELLPKFCKFPENLREELLCKFSEIEETAGILSGMLIINFGKLSEDIRNELLLKLSEKDKVAWAVADVLTVNFDRLPENIRSNLLSKLLVKKGATGTLVRMAIEKYDKYPEMRKLLYTLSKRDETAEEVARIFIHNFDKLQENVRNELLYTLLERENATFYVVMALSKDFYKLDENIKNKMLQKLSGKEYLASTYLK